MTGTRDSIFPRALFEQAIRLQRDGNHASAVDAFERLLDEIPPHAEVLNSCALSCLELGEHLRARNLFERAIEVQPDHVNAWNNLGLLCQEQGDLSGAIHAYAKVRRLLPDSPFGFVNYGNVCQLLGRYLESVDAYQHALTLNSELIEVWVNLARAHLYLGAWRDASTSALRAMSLVPGHTGALTIHSVALQELGARAEWTALLDFDRLIQEQVVVVPEGYADLSDFNQALCDYCVNHPSLEFEPTGKTTTEGYQTANLAGSNEVGPIGPLVDAINSAARDYIVRHTLDPNHPFLAQRPKRWRLSAWGTVLSSQGYQAAHIHRSAWLSGVYYVKVPDAVSADDEKHNGWIGFGGPKPYPSSVVASFERFFHPKEGWMLLFPSYFYHRTLPFKSSDIRVSIAFDLLPV